HAGNGVTEWQFNNEFKLPTDKDGSEIYTQYTDAGGNVYYTASVTYPQALAAPANIPTAKNKMFKQWSEEAGSSVAFTGFDKKDYIVSNLDLYATWLEFPVVTFNYSDNLGTDYGWTDNDDEYYTVGTNYTATAFVEVTGTGLNPTYGKVKRPSDPYKKVGNVKYALDYWAYNGAEFDFNTLVSGNITLTAVYSTPVYSFDFACFSFKEGKSTDPVVGAEFTLKAVGMQDRVISKATVDNNYLMFNNSTGYYSIDFLLPDKEYTLTQTNASVDGFENLAGEITFTLDENGSIQNATYSGSETDLIDFEKTNNNVITTYNKVWKYDLTIEFQYLFYGVQQGTIRTITTSELAAAGFGPYYYGDYFDNDDVINMDELFTPTGDPYDKCEHIAWDPGDIFSFTGSDRTPTVRIIKSTPPQDKPFTGVAGITLDPSKMSIENITVPVKGSMSFYISSKDITAETEVSLNGFSLPVQTTINAKVFKGESARYYYLIAGGEISSFKIGDLIRAGSTNEKYVPETGDAAVAFVVDLADTDGAVLAPAATEYSVSTETSGVDHNIYINFIKPDVVGADKASANTTDVITFSGIKIPSGLFENTSSVALYAVMYDDQGKIFNLPAGFEMYASVGGGSTLYVNRTVVKLGTMQTVADTSINVEILLAPLGLLEGMYTIKLFVATIGANSIGTVEYLVADSGLVSVNERDIYRVNSNTNVYSMGGQAEIEITLAFCSNAPAISGSIRA
ncbi:MAG: hypothetical protein IJV67_02985, partial [Clostridia bacterium]|nr:hypothetical protein [Clostridia bacterium]